MNRTYRLLGFLAVAGCISVAPAVAQGYVVNTPHGIYSVRPIPRNGPTFARDLRTPEEREARERAWEARCQPRVGPPGVNGVQRYIYAAEGCEYGD
jgi:hypothetical protein